MFVDRSVSEITLWTNPAGIFGVAGRFAGHFAGWPRPAKSKSKNSKPRTRQYTEYSTITVVTETQFTEFSLLKTERQFHDIWSILTRFRFENPSHSAVSGSIAWLVEVLHLQSEA